MPPRAAVLLWLRRREDVRGGGSGSNGSVLASAGASGRPWSLQLSAGSGGCDDGTAWSSAGRNSGVEGTAISGSTGTGSEAGGGW